MNITTKFQPLGDLVLAKRITTQQGLIALPDEVADRSQVCEVHAVGRGRIHKKTGEIIPHQLKAGQRVFVHPNSGYKVRIEGDEFFMFDEDEVLAVLSDDVKVEGSDEA